MNHSGPTGFLIVSHGSPRAEVNERFAALVERIAVRIDAVNVLPAYFSIVRPDIPEQIAALASRGVRRIVLMPYFLYTGQHVRADIPEILEECRRRFPEIALELQPTLENDPALEDLMVERLSPLTDARDPLPGEGTEIERRSYQIIERQMSEMAVPAAAAAHIVRRIVHATADIAFARSLYIHPQAVAQGRAALAAGRPVLCDVRMLAAGLTKLQNEIVCAIDDPAVAAAAKAKCGTRAAAAMERLAPRFEGAIVAIGNAPTALWKLLEIVGNGGPRPALIVGLPVGFVGARESKLALRESGLCCITNISPRGGSPVAAAALNALATWNE